ncbi:hypothetical protein LDENG_00166770 [Lucifuga dentata]|nr:hypothetical protein LDENG_00166770 [Lucifuga dentata]
MAVFGFIVVIFAVSLYYGESRFIIDSFSSIAHKSLTPGICSKCSQIMEISTNMISSKDSLETVYETLHSLCQRLPGGQTSECDSQVKMYLPKVLQHTAGHLKSSEACMVFGLCAVQSEQEKKLTHQATEEHTSHSGLSTNTHVNGQATPTCTLCMFIIKKLENLLPKNMTEDALRKLMGEICDLIPHSYKEECDDFIAKYGTQIIDFLLSSAAPHTICTLLHLCFFKESAGREMSLPSDCESCRTLAVLSRLHLGLNSTEPQTSSFLQSVCLHYPNAIPKCEVFTKIYSSRLDKILGNQKDFPDACERADLCAVKKSLEPLGKDRCTWGPKYWCKDVKTAQACGNLAFCEKHMWK